jgi:hypothetical protein
MALRSIVSRIRRSASSRIDCFDISFDLRFGPAIKKTSHKLPYTMRAAVLTSRLTFNST